MKWFKHFTRSHEDREIEGLIADFGVAGYGVYFYCLEIIAQDVDTGNVTFELEPDAPILARRLNMDSILVEKIMHRCIERGLFEITDGGRVSCLKLAALLAESNMNSNYLRKIFANRVALLEQNKAERDRLEAQKPATAIERPQSAIERPRMGQEGAIGSMAESGHLVAKSGLDIDIDIDRDKEERERESESSQIGKDSLSLRFEEIREVWNSFPLVPTRFNLFSIDSDDRPRVLAVLQAYTNPEILESIKTYAAILYDPKYEIENPYRSLMGFFRGGIEKFMPQASPRELYLRKSQIAADEAEQKRKALLDEAFSQKENDAIRTGAGMDR
jgi:hypothetical protein